MPPCSCCSLSNGSRGGLSFFADSLDSFCSHTHWKTSKVSLIRPTLNYKRREAVILQRQFPSCLFAVLVAVGPPVSCSLRAADRLQVASWWRRRLFFSSNMDSEFFLPLLKWEISLWGMGWDRQASVCLHPVWLVLDSLIGWRCVCDIVWLDVWAIMCLWWFLLLHCCLNACPSLKFMFMSEDVAKAHVSAQHAACKVMLSSKTWMLASQACATKKALGVTSPLSCTPKLIQSRLRCR